MLIDMVLKERERIRERVIEEVRKYAEALKSKWGKLTVVLYGSYARGDFNL